jgi:F0F1-type ATP synthase assembly protein I
MSDPEEKPNEISYRIPGEAREAPKKTRLTSDKSRKVDLIGSIIISGIVGALIDRAFQTAPYGFLVSLILGSTIAYLNFRRHP